MVAHRFNLDKSDMLVPLDEDIRFQIPQTLRYLEVWYEAVANLILYDNLGPFEILLEVETAAGFEPLRLRVPSVLKKWQMDSPRRPRPKQQRNR